MYTFKLHTVGDGPSDDSYGVQVAALAGLPRRVVERASELLLFLEKQARGARAGESGAPVARDLGQASLLGYLAATNSTNITNNDNRDIIEKLDDIFSRLDELSPKEAHDSLYQLKNIRNQMEVKQMSEPRSIVQLDDNTIGHIAAGEVVERPAQVVKKLIENSLDAEASQIEQLPIERGGFDLIKIEDNGSGISESDLPLSLDRHATSKLRTAEDLQRINTLGFRGEVIIYRYCFRTAGCK